MVRMAEASDVQDVTFMRDDVSPHSDLFPCKENVVKMIEKMGAQSDPGDYFIFFYAGHGGSVDKLKYQNIWRGASNEEDGMDEIFMLPGPHAANPSNPKHSWLDDDFADALDSNFHEDVKMLIITDCCHSSTIAEIDTHEWGNRQVCHLAACKDFQEDTDTGKGGALTTSLEAALEELAVKHGQSEYSISELWKAIEWRVKKVSGGGMCSTPMQEPTIAFTPALDPDYAAWPLPHAWWKDLG